MELVRIWREKGRCGMKIYKNPWVSRESYKSIAEMPVICENKVSIHSAIDKAVIDTILGFVEVAKRGDDNG